MTVRRWATTTVAMVAVAAALGTLAPDAGLVRAAVAGPQALVDARGPDTLVVLLAWALAALCWCWGALGLLLTGASALPGVVGRVARSALSVLLPAGLRRAAALAVGVSLVAGPVLGTHSPPVGGPALVVAGADTSTQHTGQDTADQDTADQDTADQEVSGTPSDADGPTWLTPAPDWPGPHPTSPTAADVVPDWPDPPPDGAHVVLRGDVLWDLAERWLTGRGPGAPPGPAEVAAAVQAWWQANAEVIGPDPDLLLPGQVLTPPAMPTPHPAP